MTELWARDPDGTLYAEITKDELDNTVERMQKMADRIEQLEDRLEVYSSEGVRLGENCDGIACRDETIKCLDKRIEQLEGDLQVTRLQRDARMVSEFVVDNAVKAKIEQLEALLRHARCPNKDCIDGAYPFGPDGELCECEWCDERKALLAEDRE